MTRLKHFVLSAILISSLSSRCLAQSDSSQKNIIESFTNFSDKALNAINNKYSLLDRLIERQTEKMIQRMQKKEAYLEKEMLGKDSLKAKQVFFNIQAKYQKLVLLIQSPPNASIPNPLREYIPGVDSIQTALRFLGQSGSLAGITIPGIPLDKLQQVQGVSQEVQQLEARLQSANEIQEFVKQREDQLTAQLSNFGVARELLSINKNAFYYQQQLAEYKSMLHDPQKMEEKVLETVNQVPAFQKFMSKYSFLGQLFSLPEDYGSSQCLNGLQTKAQIGQLIKERMGSGQGGGSGAGSNPQQFAQQQMQVAQQKLTELQNKIMQLGNRGGSSSNIVMPNFSPNNQKTKTFLKRLEFGFNIASTQSSFLLPATSDLGLSLGYRINDKSTVGLGADYKLGWGSGINHISFSSQGVGFRGFVDIKAKGSIWISGGFEYNFMQQFQNYSQLYDFDIWQKSALIGITKKYQITKSKGGNIQVLYDFLFKDHVPASQPLIFRFGYSFQ
jgi:hypothetical protein